MLVYMAACKKGEDEKVDELPDPGGILMVSGSEHGTLTLSLGLSLQKRICHKQISIAALI